MTNPTHIGQLMGNTTFPRTTKRIDFLRDMFTTAFEGGISYWSVTEQYQWDVDNHDEFFGIITDVDMESTAAGKPKDWAWKLGFGESGDMDSHLRIDIDTIELGITRFWEWCLGERDSLGRDILNSNCNTEELGEIVPEYEHTPDGELPTNTHLRRTHQWLSPYFRQFLVQDITSGEDGDSDANVADTIVQLGLFNEIVFG